MKISDVSRCTGASQKAIRHYETIGLLSGVRRDGIYRNYSANDVNRIRLIQKAQKLGFKLSELADYLNDGSLPTCKQVLHMVEAKQAVIQQQVDHLSSMRAQLDCLRHELMACGFTDEEPIDLAYIDHKLPEHNTPLSIDSAP